jgi:RimJ/RimL family protein N-acetyltransferase
VTPDSIRTERLLLRCWHPDDATRLKDAIDSSLPELRDWVPWAMGEPSPVERLAQRLSKMREQFATGEDWAFGVFDADDTQLLGGAGLHPRGATDHLEIGYWIRTDATRRGFALEAAAALCAWARAHANVERLEIHCDAENTRSAAVAQRLGFTLTRTFRQETVTARGGERETMVWTSPIVHPHNPTTWSSSDSAG